MNTEDKKEIVGLVCEALDQVVMPHIVEIKEILKEHDNKFDRIENTLKDHSDRLDGIEQKLDTTIKMTDRLDERVTRVEDQLELVSVK